MDIQNKLISDVTIFRTYAKFLPEKMRRETYKEIVERSKEMDISNFPKLEKDLTEAYKMVENFEIMPSMRKLQFAGEAIQKNNIRSYNCSYAPINHTKSFSEILYVLLCGTGAGYSVQRHHVNQLPSITIPKISVPYVIEDSIEGWAKALDVLCESYFIGTPRPIFDYNLIRPKGSRLKTTGARAPGHEGLKTMLELFESKIKLAAYRKLKPIEAHDLVCILSDCVRSGGIRRSALISLFDRDDLEMLTSKHGEWWKDHPYRARANNSGVLPRHEVTEEEFDHIYEMCEKSGSGEPGFSWTNDKDMGWNPCFTGDTLVAVADGRNAVSIKELADQNWTGPVYTIQNGQVGVGHCSKVWKTRENSELVKIVLDDGSSVRCTPDHRFMLRNGNYVKAKDLTPNTSLMPFNSFKRKDRNYRIISSNTGMDLAQYRHVAQYNDLIKEGYELQHIHHKDGNGLNDAIDNLEIISASEHIREHRLGAKNPIHSFKNRPSYRKARSQATQGNNNPRSLGVSGSEMYCKIYEAVLKNGQKITVRQALEECGIKYVSKGRLKEMGFNSISEAIDYAYSNMNHKVVSVEYLSEKEDVYDLTVDVTHNFAIVTSKKDDLAIDSSGVFVHNCHEIALNANQFCNLTTINMSTVRNKSDLIKRAHYASLLGTVQAAYTNFPLLRSEWRQTTEREALLGVSMTGVADNLSVLTDESVIEAAKQVLQTNEDIAKIIGINIAARATAVKPEGTASCVLASSSGVHDRHDEFYIRRIRMGKDDPLYQYLQNKVPELCEDDKMSVTEGILSIPQKSPPNAFVRANNSALGLAERAIKLNKLWVQNGYRSGVNQHNVSTTITVKNDEWEPLKKFMWENRNDYAGISLLPYDDFTYEQMPFESCDENKFEEMKKLIKNIDLSEITESDDNTARSEALSCVSGVCEIKA